MSQNCSINFRNIAIDFLIYAECVYRTHKKRSGPRKFNAPPRAGHKSLSRFFASAKEEFCISKSGGVAPFELDLGGRAENWHDFRIRRRALLDFADSGWSAAAERPVRTLVVVEVNILVHKFLQI